MLENKDAVPLLKDWFRRYDPDDPLFLASGDAPVAIGSDESTNIVLKWARQADPGQTELIGRFVDLIDINTAGSPGEFNSASKLSLTQDQAFLAAD